jgi:hypothetical protein
MNIINWSFVTFLEPTTAITLAVIMMGMGAFIGYKFFYPLTDEQLYEQEIQRIEDKIDKVNTDALVSIYLKFEENKKVDPQLILNIIKGRFAKIDIILQEHPRYNRDLACLFEIKFYCDLVDVLKARAPHNGYWKTIISALDSQRNRSFEYFDIHYLSQYSFLYEDKFLADIVDILDIFRTFHENVSGLVDMFTISNNALSFFSLSVLSFIFFILKFVGSQPILVEATRVSLSSNLHLFVCLLKYTWFNFKSGCYNFAKILRFKQIVIRKKRTLQSHYY